MANIEIAIWARGTGKSTKLIAPRSLHNVFEMPRSLGAYVASTYAQLLTRTLPGVIRGLNQMGYMEGRDFAIGRFGPRKWDKPYLCPLKADYFMHWRNGSGVVFVSQDRIGSSNGLSVDWIIGDEAKLLKHDRLKEELMPTLRGNENYFGHLACHKSVLFSTDMPTTSSAAWLFQFEEMMDTEVIETILKLQYVIYEYQLDWDSYTEATQKQYMKKINKINDLLNELRKGLVYYSEASALDNIDVLGVDYIKNQSKLLTPGQLRASIFNIRPKKIENGFYAFLKPAIHGYTAYDYDYLQSRGIRSEEEVPLTCLSVKDIDPNAPLDVALDNGSRINCVVTGQLYQEKNEYRMLSGFYVTHPEKVKDLARKWCDFYQAHPTREVNYFFDHTAIGKHGVSEYTYSEEWIQVLTSNNWHVNTIYLGRTKNYDIRYNFWSDLLREVFSDLPAFRYNENLCHDVETSMLNAPVRKDKEMIVKDKSSEKDPAIPPQEATDYSDAADTLLYGKIGMGLGRYEGTYHTASA